MFISRARKLTSRTWHVRFPILRTVVRSFQMTPEERAILEAEAKRTRVLSSEERQELYTEKKKDRVTPEESDTQFSDKYLAKKGIPYQVESSQIIDPSTFDMDPKLIQEISKWNFVNQKDVKLESDGKDLAVMIRIKELEQCEERADKKGNYTIPGRVTESQMRELLTAARNGESIDAIISSNQMNKAEVDTLLKFAKAPVFKRPTDGDDYVLAV